MNRLISTLSLIASQLPRAHCANPTDINLQGRPPDLLFM